MTKVDTILFDLDGTLINSIYVIKRSFRHTFEIMAKDYELTDEEVISFIGPPLETTFKPFAGDDVEEWVEVYREHNLANQAEYLTVFDGVVKTVECLANDGYKLGIVTSKRIDSATLGLELSGLKKYFPVLIGSDSVTEHKPSKEPVLKAMELLEPAGKVMMVGDRIHDIEAAKNASVISVGVKWTVNLEEIINSNPDYILEKFSDIYTIIEEENKNA